MKMMFFILAFTLMLTAPSFAFYNSSYLGQTNFTLNANAALTNVPYPVNDTNGINTASMISLGRLQSNCADLQITNGTATVKQAIEIVNGSCNSANTEVWSTTNSTTSTFNNTLNYNDSQEVAHTNEEAHSVWDLNYTMVWHLSNNGTFNDSTSIGENGTKVGTAVYNNTGRFGGAYSFNYIATSRITYPDIATLRGGMVTVEMWVYLMNTTTDGGLANSPQFSWSGNGKGWLVQTASGKIFAFVTDSGNVNKNVMTTAVLPKNVWTYIVFTYDKSYLRIYINGVLNASTAGTGNPIGYSGTSTVGAIGQPADGAITSPNATIDEVRISNIARSADYILAMNGTGGINLSKWGAEELNGGGGGGDTTSPTVTITNPTNATNLSTTYLLNFTVTDNIAIDKCWWINTTGVNQSLPSCGNTSWTEDADGYKNNTVCTNDTSGNTGCTQRFFTKVSFPTWSLNSTNTTLAGVNTLFSILWSNPAGILDGYNFTWCNGAYNITSMYCGSNFSNNAVISVPTTIGTTNELMGENKKNNIVKDSKGYLWMTFVNGTSASLSNSTNNGSTWTFVRTVVNGLPGYAQNERAFVMTINSTDGLLFAWSDYSANSYFQSYNTNTQVLSSPVTLSGYPRDLSIEVNATDAIVIVHCGSSGNCAAEVSTNAGSSFTTNAITMSDETLAMNLYIDRDSNAHVFRAAKGTFYGRALTMNLQYFNASKPYSTWSSKYDLTPFQFNNSGTTTAMYKDFAGIMHFAYTGRPDCQGACDFGVWFAALWYLNDSGNGTFTTPVNLSRTDITRGIDNPYFVQTNNTNLYIFAADPWYNISDNCYYWIQYMSNRTWTPEQMFLEKTKYPQPRGTTFPSFNSMDNSNLIDLTIANITSPYNYIYMNISFTSGSQTNDSWSSDAFAHFGATGWANVSKTVNSTVGSVIAYKWWANTTLNQANETSIFYYTTTPEADTIIPTITISSPTNISYNTKNITLNYSASDTNLQICKFQNNTINYTLSGCQNITFTGLEGANTVKVFVNDTSNNTNVSSVSFSVDSILPTITIISPTASNYNTSIINLNWTANELLSWAAYKIDNQSNITLLEYCQQNDYNNSYENNGQCKQANTGSISNNSYWDGSLNISRIDDNNETTTIQGLPNTEIPIVYINYSIPLMNITSIIIQYTAKQSGSCQTSNYTIDANSILGNNNILSLKMTAFSTSPAFSENKLYVYNNSLGDYSTIAGSGGSYNTNDEICEIKVFWKTSQNQTFTFTNGPHNITVFANDTMGNMNFTKVSFTVNSGIAPTVAIQSPTNTTYSSSSIPLNFTISGGNPISICTRELDGANTTITSCDNQTMSGLSPGSHAVKVYANDTVNNTGVDGISFYIDDIAPAVTIQNPINIIYTINITLNFTVSDYSPINCVFQNNTINFTLAGCNNITFTALEGINTIKIFVNDTLNNTNVSSISFTSDTQVPSLSLILPANDTYNSSTVNITFLASDANLDKCWYNIDSGSNVTLSGCLNTTFVSSSGTHRFRIYANDTVGLWNMTEINYTSTNAVLLSITVHDEQNPGNLVLVFNTTITDNAAIYLTKNTTTGSILLGDNIELPDGNYDIIISSDGWITRTYYDIPTVNTSTYNLSAYLLNSSAAISVQFVSKNNYNNALPNTVITVRRYINGSWVVVGEGKTESSGTLSISLQSSVTYTGNASYASYNNQSKTFTATDSPITFTFGTDIVPDYYYILRNNLVANCMVSNATTRSINCTVNDSSSIATSITLRVVRMINTSTSAPVCSNTDSIRVDSMFETYCSLGAGNGTWIYRLTASTTSGTYILAQGSFTTPLSKPNYGMTGLLLAFILFIIVTFIGIWNPPAAIIFGMISLFASWELGLIQLSSAGWGSLISMMFVGIIVMYKLRG